MNNNVGVKYVTIVRYEFYLDEAKRLCKKLNDAGRYCDLYIREGDIAEIAFVTDRHLWAELNGVLRVHSTVIKTTIPDTVFLDEVDEKYKHILC